MQKRTAADRQHAGGMDFTPPYVEKIEPGIWRLKITVQPGAKDDAVAGILGKRIKVLVKAPPVDGKANKSVCLLLSRLLGVKKSQVQISKGFSSRHKDVLVFHAHESAFETLLAGQD